MLKRRKFGLLRNFIHPGKNNLGCYIASSNLKKNENLGLLHSTIHPGKNKLGLLHNFIRPEKNKIWAAT
jgi:hypothetical protein